MKKQIIALGGGGFSMEPENPLLDDYIIRHARKEKPSICFLPTASGDSADYINRFYQSFKTKNCEPTHLSLFKPPTRNLKEFVLQQDIIYVGGGNTVNLILLWKHWGLDGYLHEAWQKGTILAGLSAGSICWFEEGITDSYGDGLEPVKGLGFLKGSHSPHYDGEANRRPTFHRFIKEGKVQAGLAADDGVAFHYIDEQLHTIVKSRKSADAYRVQMQSGELIEEKLNSHYLGT